MIHCIVFTWLTVVTIYLVRIGKRADTCENDIGNLQVVNRSITDTLNIRGKIITEFAGRLQFLEKLPAALPPTTPATEVFRAK